jgi:pyridoxamine 5'-phosphate oxidase
MSSPLSSSIADLRKSYERAELGEDASHADPLRQFDQWLQEALAAQVPEPNAMTLATVGSDLRPSTRIVLVKGYDERGIVWFTASSQATPMRRCSSTGWSWSAWCASKAWWKR